MITKPKEMNGKHVVYLLECWQTPEMIAENIQNYKEVVEKFKDSTDPKQTELIDTVKKVIADLESKKDGYWLAIDGKFNYEYIKRQMYEKVVHEKSKDEYRVNRGLIKKDAETWIGCEIIGWDKKEEK